jgi:hypothetical protein
MEQYLLRQLGQFFENWLMLKTKPQSGNLACPIP